MSHSYVEKEFRGEKFYFISTPQAGDLIEEIFSDNYRVFASGLKFKPGDVVLDVGACEGMFSIMIKAFFPKVRVIALEPVPRTYGFLRQNIALNKRPSAIIETYNFGVARESGKHELFVGHNNYSGGSSAMLTHDPEKTEKIEVDVLSLDDVFKQLKIKKCKLMKMDIEGMEYDSLYYTKVIPKIENFVGEFHTNWRIDHKGRRMDGLANWLSTRTKVICVEACRMAE